MKQKEPIQKLKNKVFTLNIEVKKEEIQAEYKEHLEAFRANFETKGFRKGKAPLDVVESQISPEKMFEEVASHVISHHYADAIKANDLKPIIQPQVRFVSEKPDFENDWEVEITSCELPEIELKEKYLTDIKKINQDKTLTDENKKMDQIVKAIMDNSQLDLPEILINSDTEIHLSQLVDQATQAGITVEKYLESQKQTLDQYKEDIKKRVVEEWTINLAISKIAKDNKIEVTETEVKDILEKNPALSQNINMVYYLLTQQKVFDFLKK
jgi:FKBP-type peptidyl-prolyl cis-trans isomerase (trigger factor)